MLGFLSSIRSDPEIAEVFRDTAISPHARAPARRCSPAELGDDHPDLDLRATAGPAILFYQAAVCGKPMDADAMAERLTTLLFAPQPAAVAE